jgi:hypothetical protein
MIQNNERKIVRSRPGAGTCETIYTDDHGESWIHDPLNPPTSDDSTTGKRVGYIHGGSIWPTTI